VQGPTREVLTDDPALGDRAKAGPGPEDALLAAERRAILAAALATLPARQLSS
jgi:DNA-directed RNA polymerase specialized sigma24 family protein